MQGSPLILVFGLPRSGTTWVGKIFDSHPATLYRHEPDSWSALAPVPLVATAAEADEHADRVGEFVAGLPERRETKVAGSTPVFPKRYLSGARLAWLRLGIAGARGVARVRGECTVPRAVDPDQADRVAVVWKSIESIGRLGLLAQALPAARGILLVRHPCGFVASVQRGERSRNFTSGTPASEDYGILQTLVASEAGRRYGLSLAYLRTLTPEERLAWRWVLFNETGMDGVAGDGRFLTVRYEDLCLDPVGVTDRMFRASGLDLHPQTETFLAQSTRSDRGGYFSVYKDSRRAAEQWRRELAPEAVERILEVVKGSRPGGVYQDLVEGLDGAVVPEGSR